MIFTFYTILEKKESKKRQTQTNVTSFYQNIQLLNPLSRRDSEAGDTQQ